jgi:hypothetical protein
VQEGELLEVLARALAAHGGPPTFPAG